MSKELYIAELERLIAEGHSFMRARDLAYDSMQESLYFNSDHAVVTCKRCGEGLARALWKGGAADNCEDPACPMLECGK